MLAPNLGVLITARVLLGFGTCAGYPAAMYLVRSEADRTGRDSPAAVLTALAVTTQTVAVIGPSLGGLLIGLGGWRTTLAVNIPLALAGLYLGARRLPRTAPAPRTRGSLATTLDLAGMALFAAALVPLLLFLMHPSPGDWYLPAVTVLAAACFGRREHRAANPFIDLRVLGGNLPLLATYTRALLAYTVAYAFLYGCTQWMQEGRGLSAPQAGLVQLPLFGTAIVVSAVTGRRRRIRGKLLAGALGQIAACTLVLLLGPHSPIWLLLVVALAFGIPQGLNGLALQSAVYHQADPAWIGSSAGLLRTFSYLGAIVAAAATGAFLGHGADTVGLHQLAWFMLAAAVLYLLVTVADRSLRQVGAPPPDIAAPAAPPAPAAAGDPQSRGR